MPDLPRITPVGAPRRAGVGGGSDRPVSPATITGKLGPSLKARREIILLGGDTNSGKSYQWAKMAEAEMRRAQQQDRAPANFYIIDTDDTTSTMLNEGDEFEALYYENGGNVYPYPAFKWNDVALAVKDIMAKAQRGDWVVADVINRFYDDAQDELADRRGFNVDDRAIAAGMTSKGFNGIDPGDWIMIRRIHDSAVKQLIFSTEANLLALCHLTEVSDVAGRERREILTTFDEVGLKPQGAPRLPGAMHTIVFLWSQRIIKRDERNRRSPGGARTVRYLTVIKDRGNPFNIVKDLMPIEQGTFYDQLKQIRMTESKPIQITQEEAAGLETDTLTEEPDSTEASTA